MLSKLTLALRPVVASLALALGAHGAAHAGLVTGNWDPQFGSFLPGLSWFVQGTFLVPNACSAQIDGSYSTSSGDCGGSTIQSVALTMFNTGAPGTQHTWNLVPGLLSAGDLSRVRVEAGTVVGFESATKAYAQTLNFDAATASYFSLPSSAEGNLFSLKLDLFGPTLTCVNCEATLDDVVHLVGASSSAADVVSSTNGLTQFLVTYTSDDTTVPKFTDGSGNAAGARLNGDGTLLGFFPANPASIPEPATAALALLALAALGASRRQR